MDPHINFYRRRGKRIFDVFAASAALIVLAPLLGLIALVVRIALGSPVLFSQIRGGLHQHPFHILKFRSMTDGRDPAGRSLPDNARITRLGRFLRATSLDELPELWNVLRGEMSLVGPRPLPLDEVRRFDDLSHRRRLSVRPGLTCTWQVSGRNDTTYEERVAFDEYYIRNWSLWMDLYILARTFQSVVHAEGAY